MNSTVSLIIPTYQGTESISIAVESALKQTYHPIEIIVVDDNGKGTEEQVKTEHVLQKYINNKDIIYIAHEENINGSAARNTGMKKSTGTYITFLDDDDYLLPSKIEKQVSVFETLDDEYGMVFCSGYVVRKTGVGYKLKMIDDDILYNLLCGNLRFNSTMIMIRRDVFESTNGFDESYKRHQDWEFCCRVLYKYKGKGIDEHLVYKYLTDRNVPTDPDKAEEMRSYFLGKNMQIIDSLGEKKKKRIVAYHHRDLSLTCIFAKQYKRAFSWLRKDNSTFIQMIRLVKYALKRKLVHREKYAPSYSELLQLSRGNV